MSITLDSIRASIEQKYATFDIEGTGVSLRNPLRLSREDRTTLFGYQDQLDKLKDANEQIALLAELLVLVSSDKAAARRLLKSLDGDPDADVILMEVINRYMEDQQAGEASPSES